MKRQKSCAYFPMCVIIIVTMFSKSVRIPISSSPGFHYNHFIQLSNIKKIFQRCPSAISPITHFKLNSICNLKFETFNVGRLSQTPKHTHTHTHTHIHQHYCLNGNVLAPVAPALFKSIYLWYATSMAKVTRKHTGSPVVTTPRSLTTFLWKNCPMMAASWSKLHRASSRLSFRTLTATGIVWLACKKKKRIVCIPDEIQLQRSDVNGKQSTSKVWVFEIDWLASPAAQTWGMSNKFKQSISLSQTENQCIADSHNSKSCQCPPAHKVTAIRYLLHSVVSFLKDAGRLLIYSLLSEIPKPQRQTLCKQV